MSKSFFNSIAGAVANSGKRINLDVTGLPGGKIKVLITANVGSVPVGASEQEAQLIAALSKPMLVSGTAEEVEEALVSRLAVHGAAVDEGVAFLEQIRAAGKSAAGAVKTQPEAQASDDLDEESPAPESAPVNLSKADTATAAANF